MGGPGCSFAPLLDGGCGTRTGLAPRLASILRTCHHCFFLASHPFPGMRRGMSLWVEWWSLQQVRGEVTQHSHPSSISGCRSIFVRGPFPFMTAIPSTQGRHHPRPQSTDSIPIHCSPLAVSPQPPVPLPFWESRRLGWPRKRSAPVRAACFSRPPLACSSIAVEPRERRLSLRDGADEWKRKSEGASSHEGDRTPLPADHERGSKSSGRWITTASSAPGLTGGNQRGQGGALIASAPT